MRSQSYIGLDRVIRLKWLQKVSSYVCAGETKNSIRSLLLEELKKDFGCERVVKRGSLDKTLSILMRIWVGVPEGFRPLRDDGIRLLSELPKDLHVAIHWGMVMAVYPFWGMVATHVGRLLRLQGVVNFSQVRTRIVEKYGQKPTVEFALRKTFASMVDWGVIERLKKENGGLMTGVYQRGMFWDIDLPDLIAWLAEALIRARRNESITLDEFISSPSLFPIRVNITMADNVGNISGRIEVIECGVDQKLLVLNRR